MKNGTYSENFFNAVNESDIYSDDEQQVSDSSTVYVKTNLFRAKGGIA